MDLRAIIHEVGRGAHGARDLAEEDAYRLYGSMLDGEVPELELGALLIAYRIKGESVDELKGFCRALAERSAPLESPGKVLPVNAEEGVWTCTAIAYCSVVCPKHVDPANAINLYKMKSAMDYFLRLAMPRGARK